MFHIGVKLCMFHLLLSNYACFIFFGKVFYILLSNFACFILCCQCMHDSYFVVKLCMFHIVLSNYTCFICCCQIMYVSYFAVKVNIIIPTLFLKKRGGYCNCLRPSICLSFCPSVRQVCPLCYRLLNHWTKFNQIC